MIFEISFPCEGGDKASLLAQEARLAFLQNGANPNKVEIVKKRADTMDLGATIQLALDVYHAFRSNARKCHARSYSSPLRSDSIRNLRAIPLRHSHKNSERGRS